MDQIDPNQTPNRTLPRARGPQIADWLTIWPQPGPRTAQKVVQNDPKSDQNEGPKPKPLAGVRLMVKTSKLGPKTSLKWSKSRSLAQSPGRGAITGQDL